MITQRQQQHEEYHRIQKTTNELMQKQEITYQWPTLLSTDVTQPSIKWIIGSRFIVPMVGLFSKFWMNVVNRSTVYNANILYDMLDRNYLSSQCQKNVETACRDLPRRPVITYCNHTSCMDDPLIWGSLMPLSWLFNSNRQRWTTAAAEICFSSPLYTTFFSLGKTFPIVRGEGIYQPAMNYAFKLMRNGNWLHFFPEGKVIPRPEHSDPNLLKSEKNSEKLQSNDDNLDKSNNKLLEPYSLKWGIARLIIEHVLSEGEDNDEEYLKIVPNKNSLSGLLQDTMLENECKTLPEVDVLPIYHFGMDEVLPTRKPYIPRIFCRVTFLVRPEGPIRIDKNFLTKLFTEGQNDLNNLELSLSEKRIRLMKFLENELNILAEKAKLLHFHHKNS